MTSIIIAAHNEAAVVGRCLDALLLGAAPGEFDVTVVANGCTDATAQVAAARSGVRVLDLPVAGKVTALNAGDSVAIGFPRIYLDADIVIPTEGVRALHDALTVSNAATAIGAMAAAPRRDVDVSRSPLLVRAYFAINSRLPVFPNSLLGRGVVALSAEGRRRFDKFPDVVADDLFLDSLFTAAEKRIVDRVSAQVAAPRQTRGLLRRLVRLRRANARIRADRAVGGGEVRRVARTSWLRDVALRHPTLIPAAGCYAAITITASVLASLPQRPGDAWQRDDSSRQDDYPTGDVEPADGRG
ncbi:MAG TPA: glycosyltransferase [Streptosporangiaceae bacterium]|nr:glycosyltransferase [Streptosporangiaceae bacterium]